MIKKTFQTLAGFVVILATGSTTLAHHGKPHSCKIFLVPEPGDTAIIEHTRLTLVTIECGGGGGGETEPPPSGPAISGPTGVPEDSAQTYTIVNSASTQWSWSINPSGAGTITSGNGSATITVQWAAGPTDWTMTASELSVIALSKRTFLPRD